MKTAISLSDSLFEVAEQTAQYMGIPRSRLYALALEEYVARHNGEMITRKLNEVYDAVDSSLDPCYVVAQAETLRDDW